jgi:hypothetical protein
MAPQKFATQNDADDVLRALRLGWGVAELRGRNRPGGPPGDIARMPDHVDHALPLRIERGQTELRIEVQCVVAALARDLHVDHTDDQPSFGQALDDKAKLLGHVRAPAASAGLLRALELLDASGDATQALAVLRAARSAQDAVVAGRVQAVAAARRVLAEAEEQVGRPSGFLHHLLIGQVGEAAGPPEREEAELAVRRAAAALELELATYTGEEYGLKALSQVIEALEQSVQAGVESIRQHHQVVATNAEKCWRDLAELIWEFDAHVQDGLAAVSETQAIAYQLGRGLAETYWALDPADADGSTGWNFLLGDERCSELCRLVGRLSTYLDEYTAAAIAGSVEVWKEVVKTPAWLGNTRDAQQALYRQIRRWFELLILGQDPTTLVRPGAVIKDYRIVLRAARLFWPQLAGTVIGLGFLAALLVLLSVGSGAAWAKTLSGVVAVAGLSLAGLTGTLKNSAQAMLKRLRQDSYTDLVAIAVQTAPPAPKKSDVEAAIRRRPLTPATPN